jgi:FAD:protein FMN transferase
MGVPVSLDVRGPGDAGAIDAAFAVLHDADRRFSKYRPDSTLSRIRRGELDARAGGPLLQEVLATAEWAAAASGGAFDVRDPDGLLDTDGVVKGWAAQRAADVLRRAGLSNFCLNTGGDVVTRGEPEPGRAWQVAVRHPHDRLGSLAVLSLRDGAVATSGTYERGSHVWDGRAHARPLDLVAATVVAGELALADVLATSVLAMGPSGIEWGLTHGASLVLVVDRHGAVLSGGVSG